MSHKQYKELKVGDKVFVTKRVDEGICWGPSMDKTTSTVLIVRDIEVLQSGKVYLYLSNGYYYPRSSLRKLRSK